MMDYRQPLNRLRYFDHLYAMNLDNGVLPGLVYLYMPALATRYGWDEEQKLWFAFLNGMTQNPITSLVMMDRMPEVPVPGQGTLLRFAAWFDENWENLSFDTDRRYQKKDTVLAIEGYARMVQDFQKQTEIWSDSDYRVLWSRAVSIPTFGRLAAFSYLEYVRIMGHGADCDDLMFGDRSGSKSHRNGMLLLLGKDRLVWDKRAQNGFDGDYEDFKGLCALLTRKAEEYLEYFRTGYRSPQSGGAPPNVSRFTLESNLCTFKNHFYGRRYPGVYADMAWDRIVRAEEHGLGSYAQVFKDIREQLLPDWLRIETRPDELSIKQRGAFFAETGYPYRGEHFLEPQG